MTKITACPKCGSRDFRLYVMQRIRVEFSERGDDGEHDVYAGPEGDIEWDDDTEAICNNCYHFGPLGKMVVEQVE